MRKRSVLCVAVAAAATVAAAAPALLFDRAGASQHAAATTPVRPPPEARTAPAPPSVDGYALTVIPSQLSQVEVLEHNVPIADYLPGVTAYRSTLTLAPASTAGWKRAAKAGAAETGTFGADVLAPYVTLSVTRVPPSVVPTVQGDLYAHADAVGASSEAVNGDPARLYTPTSRWRTILWQIKSGTFVQVSGRDLPSDEILNAIARGVKESAK